MNNSSRPMSGLGKVKRNFSTNSVDVEEVPIPWSSSPPTSAPAPPARTKTLGGIEARLKAIQDALDSGSGPSKGVLATSARNNANTASSSRSDGMMSLKRPSPSSSIGGPAAKKRSLPDTWSQPAPSSSSGKSSSATAGSSTIVKIAPSADMGKPAKVFLSPEQQKILKLVETGESIFYTGSAGTGKSVLLREIIRAMKRKYIKSIDAVAITASTGLAACNIGGMTIHSFAGIGLGIETAEELATKIRKNKKAMSRWLRSRVLIIDEVSMVEADLFDKLCKIGSILTKRPDKPFGGMQLIVTGDFFQLPPVVKTGETRFAFEADCWGKVIQRTFNLTKVFRQRDQEFIDMLNEMRFGRLSQKSIARFNSLRREVKYDDDIAATELFPRREDVERSNVSRMTNLRTEQHTYCSNDGGSLQDEAAREKLLANFMAAKSLQLRVGAQVMLIKNTDEMLVNGSLGKIVRFVDPSVYTKDSGGDHTFDGPADAAAGAASKTKKPAPASGVVWPVVLFTTPNKGQVEAMIEPATWKVELPNGEVQVSRTQLPLILSWAMSIHKSQGQTLERVKVDLGKVFEKGQAYVALSRATSLDGLQVLNFDPSKVNAHPKVVEWSKTLEEIQG